MINVGNWRFAGRVAALARLVACYGVLFLSAALLLASQAPGALYIGTTSIARVNLDGSVFQANFIPPQGGDVCAIAADSSHIYWADGYDNTIGRANLDGTAIYNNFITLADGTLPCGLAVSSEYIYWSSLGSDAIGRARLDGLEVNESFISTVQHPCAIAIDKEAIYWASDDEDQIWRTDIEAVNAPEIVVDENATDSCGLALVGPHLFWVESDAGTIGRSNLDGSEPLPAFIAGGHYPVSLVAQGGHLYWVNNDSGSVGRASLDGANVTQSFIGGLEHPYALAADSVQVVSRAAIPPPPSSSFRLGKIRRSRDGSVFFPVHLHGKGWLEAEAPGAGVTLRPNGVEARAMLGAGRKWLRVAPTTKRGNGSRCVLRAFRRGRRVELMLYLRFVEPGKAVVAKSRRLLLFEPHRTPAPRPKVKAFPVSCLA